MRRNHISNDSVLLDVRRMTCAEGRSKGTELFRVTNAAGLDFDVLIDRCMSIGSLRLDGQLISYTSETGIVHPAYYEKDGFGWLRSFGGGFLATCGLTQVGEPCEGHGLHGRIDNLPAEEVGWKRWWEEDILWAEITGTVYQACHQGEYLSLRRTLRLRHDANVIWLTDTVCNQGNSTQPCMLLYHINLGAPFLKPGTTVTLPPNELQCFDNVSHQNKAYAAQIPDIPNSGMDLLWLHHPTPADMQTAVVDNGLRTVSISYSGRTLPILGQWELLMPQAYVLALEPTNTHLQGQAWEQNNGTLQHLAPGQTLTTTLTFTFT